MQNLKGKITFQKLDASAFVISTLVSSYGISEQLVSLKFDKKSKERAEVMNVQLELQDKEASHNTIGGDKSYIYGEQAISDYLLALKNTTLDNHVARLGGFMTFGGLGNPDLNSEHFMNEINYGAIRNIVNLFI